MGLAKVRYRVTAKVIMTVPTCTGGFDEVTVQVVLTVLTCTGGYNEGTVQSYSTGSYYCTDLYQGV